MTKRILVLNSQVDFWGAGRSCAMSLIALKEAGYEVMMLSAHEGPLWNLLQTNGIRCISLPRSPWIYMRMPGNFAKRFLLRLRSAYNLICKMKPICGSIVSMLEVEGFKPDLIYSNTILEHHGPLLAKHYGVGHIYHIREFGKEDFQMHFTLGRMYSHRIANKNLFTALCISKGVENAWRHFFNGKTKLLYNGLPCESERFYPRQKHDSILQMLLVGRIAPEKKQREVICAIERLVEEGNKDIHIDLYGSGVDEVELKQYVDSHQLNNYISFCGFSHEIPYDKYDVAIMSSHHEGFGRTTIEYIFHSLPVIGYDGGATPEIIENETTGMLYNSMASLMQCILFARDHYEVLNGFAENAFITAKQRFTEELYKANFLKIIKQVIDTKYEN